MVEMSTSGGDADVGRRMAQEVRMWKNSGREVFFLGKTYVFSAGITIMSAFPVTHRFLTADCELLIHERKIEKTLHLEGALRGCMTAVNDVLAEIESGQRLEREGFVQLAEGSRMTAQDIENRIYTRDWYLTAQEAFQRGLVGGVI